MHSFVSDPGAAMISFLLEDVLATVKANSKRKWEESDLKVEVIE